MNLNPDIFKAYDIRGVYPGEIKYYTTAYTPSGGGAPSFDYDCSGSEDLAGSPAKGSVCTADPTVTSSCGGGGWLKATPERTGPGVDPYCGSSKQLVCGKTPEAVCGGRTIDSPEALRCK